MQASRGDASTVTHKVLQLRRAEIVITLSVLLGERRLKIGRSLEGAGTLARQMKKLQGPPPRPTIRSTCCMRPRCTTASSQPAYDTTIGAETTDGTAVLKAYDSFTRVASAESVTDYRIFHHERGPLGLRRRVVR